MNAQVTEFINNAPADQKAMMEKLRNIIHQAVPDVTEEFKWGRPVFKKTKDFAYFKSAKAYLTLGFFNYTNLRDDNGLLEGTGKDMRHIKLKNAGNIDEKLMKEWFETAAK